jgi:hypothetical protein
MPQDTAVRRHWTYSLLQSSHTECTLVSILSNSVRVPAVTIHKHVIALASLFF